MPSFFYAYTQSLWTYPLLQPEEGAQDLKNLVKHLGALMCRDGWTGITNMDTQ